MTTELQRVMARYEDARIGYRKAVLASLHGTAGGEEIRSAIREVQSASADLRRLTGGPPRSAASAQRPLHPANTANTPLAPSFAFFRRLVSAG